MPNDGHRYPFADFVLFLSIDPDNARYLFKHLDELNAQITSWGLSEQERQAIVKADSDACRKCWNDERAQSAQYPDSVNYFE